MLYYVIIFIKVYDTVLNCYAAYCLIVYDRQLSLTKYFTLCSSFFFLHLTSN